MLLSLLRKIFLGVNASGALRRGRAGDTRTEVSMLITGLSMCAILGVWALGAYVVQKQNEIKEIQNMKKEVLREKEYREVCMYTAVHTCSFSFGSALLGIVDPKTALSIFYNCYD